VAGVSGCAMKCTPRRRRCPHCKKLFCSDPRTRDRQRFCPTPACQKARKARSNERWRSKPENRDHWRGPGEVQRVREWRKEHPGYWRRSTRRERGGTLQDKFGAQAGVAERLERAHERGPLQVERLPDDPLLVGIIATVAGSTLQADIAAACRRLIAVGCDILRRKTTAEAGSSAPKPINPA
jgi:hypothetical protein